MELKNVQLECSSLAKVAKAFCVPISTVRKWRQQCYALSKKHKPYNLADIAMYLLLNRIIKPEQLTNEVKSALALSLSGNAVHNAEMAKFTSRVDFRELIYGNKEEALKRAKAAVKPPPLFSDDSAAIAIACPKSAALFVDRVWSIDPTVPWDIEFDCGTLHETVTRGFIPTVLEFAFQAKLGLEELDAKIQSDDDTFFEEMDREERVVEQIAAPFLEELVCAPIQKASGRTICPFMSSKRNLRNLHQEGEFEAVAICIDSMKVVDERQLTWDQVRQFRSDTESRKKLKRFLHWMDGSLVGKPLSFVQDEISIRLEEYEKAINSWGIKTTMGIFGALVDARTWMGIFGAAGTAALAARTTSMESLVPAIVASVGLGVLGGKVTHDLVKIRIEEKARRNRDEIAYLYEVRNKMNTN